MKKLFPMIILLLALQACTVSTAKIGEVKTCDSLAEEESMCKTDTTVFNVDTPEIYLTSELLNAPTDTEISMTWRYLEGSEPEIIDGITIKSPDYSPSYPYTFLPKPDAGWPTGKYDVVVILGTDNSEPLYKEFRVE